MDGNRSDDDGTESALEGGKVFQVNLLPVCGQHSHLYSVVAFVLVASWLHR